MTNPGDKYTVKLGDFLGEMTDEVADRYGKEARIVEYASTGAKSYGFKVKKEDGNFEYECKSKGFHNDYETGKCIYLDKMIGMVKKKCNYGESEVVTVHGTGIRRTKEHQLTTRPVTKTFQMTANKQKVIPGTYEMRPFGYQ